MHVAALAVELHLPDVHSLKEKRAVLRPIIDGAKHRFSVSAAEVGHQDTWQRATVGVAVVSGKQAMVENVIDGVERFIWSFPEVEVLDASVRWLETE